MTGSPKTTAELIDQTHSLLALADVIEAEVEANANRMADLVHRAAMGLLVWPEAEKEGIQ